MTTDTIRHLGAEFHRAADSLADTLARLDMARTARLAFLRECSKDSTARLAALKEEIRTLPEQIAKWDAEAARLESQTAEDLLRQALDARKCDGDHKGPLCADKQCWLRDPEEAEQPTMSCPSCKREYPDFDGAGVMVCTACWEAQEEEQPETPPAPTLLDLTKLPPGTVCEALEDIPRWNGRTVAAGVRFTLIDTSTEEGDEFPMVVTTNGENSYCIPYVVPARVVEVPR